MCRVVEYFSVSWLFRPRTGNSGGGIRRWCIAGHIACNVGVISAVMGRIIRLALRLALELFFFFALFRKLFLALFVGVIGSCHSVLS